MSKRAMHKRQAYPSNWDDLLQEVNWKIERATRSVADFTHARKMILLARAARLPLPKLQRKRAK